MKSSSATSEASIKRSEAREGRAQIAFLLKPVSVDQVAETSFAGGVMPQKSTDFYPKLLSGLTIYSRIAPSQSTRAKRSSEPSTACP